MSRNSPTWIRIGLLLVSAFMAPAVGMQQVFGSGTWKDSPQVSKADRESALPLDPGLGLQILVPGQ